MADTKAKVAAKPAKVAAKPAAESKVVKKKTGDPRNYDLGNGIYRFSRTRMFHKKAIYKFLDKKTPKTVSFQRHIYIFYFFPLKLFFFIFI